MKKIGTNKKYIIAALLILALLAGGVFTGMKTMDIADAKDTGTAKTAEKKDVEEDDKAKSKDDEAKNEEDMECADKPASSGSGNGDAATTNTATSAAANSNTTTAGDGNTYVAPEKQPSTTSTSTQPAKPAHTHNWVPHYATRTVQKTFTDYKLETYSACNDCGVDVTEDPSSHSKWEVMENGRNGGWHSAQRQVPFQNTTTVQEEYTDYYYCSGCGARK